MAFVLLFLICVYGYGSDPASDDLHWINATH